MPHRDGVPTVDRVLDRGALEAITSWGGVTAQRPTDGRDLVLIRGAQEDARVVVELAERLWWFDGRGPAPRVVATGRDDAGAEAVVVELHASAAPVVGGMVPLSPEAVAEHLAETLRVVHSLPTDELLVDALPDALLRRATRRVADGEVSVAASGPYAGRSAAELLEVAEALFADLGPAHSTTVTHGNPVLEHLWLGPVGEPVLTGWEHGGRGDPHHDLAVAAASVAAHHGPALVAPLLDAYGLDGVDARRLDAHQLLAHLLG